MRAKFTAVLLTAIFSAGLVLSVTAPVLACVPPPPCGPPPPGGGSSGSNPSAPGDPGNLPAGLRNFLPPGTLEKLNAPPAWALGTNIGQFGPGVYEEQSKQQEEAARQKEIADTARVRAELERQRLAVPLIKAEVRIKQLEAQQDIVLGKIDALASKFKEQMDKEQAERYENDVDLQRALRDMGRANELMKQYNTPELSELRARKMRLLEAIARPGDTPLSSAENAELDHADAAIKEAERQYYEASDRRRSRDYAISQEIDHYRTEKGQEIQNSAEYKALMQERNSIAGKLAVLKGNDVDPNILTAILNPQ